MRRILAATTAALGLVLALCGCTPEPAVEIAAPAESAVATPILAQPSPAGDVVTPALPENAIVVAEYAASQGSLPRAATEEFVGTMGADLICTGGIALTFGILSDSSAKVPCDGRIYRIEHDSNLSPATGGLEVTAAPETRWAAVVWLYPEG